jgi:hypothetical protein
MKTCKAAIAAIAVALLLVTDSSVLPVVEEEEEKIDPELITKIISETDTEMIPE